MSTKARELLGVSERRSGRARVPSLKLRESEPPSKGKGKETDEPRLSEVRMSSEQIEQPGVYMLGVMRDGAYLHSLQNAYPDSRRPAPFTPN